MIEKQHDQDRNGARHNGNRAEFRTRKTSNPQKLICEESSANGECDCEQIRQNFDRCEAAFKSIMDCTSRVVPARCIAPCRSLEEQLCTLNAKPAHSIPLLLSRSGCTNCESRRASIYRRINLWFFSSSVFFNGKNEYLFLCCSSFLSPNV